MILSFLRLFSAYRTLESELRASAEARIKAEDHVRSMSAELREVRSELIESQKRETHAVQCVADFFSQQVTGRKIYGSAPDLPEKPMQQPQGVPRASLQGRHIVQEKRQQFIRDFDQIAEDSQREYLNHQAS